MSTGVSAVGAILFGFPRAEPPDSSVAAVAVADVSPFFFFFILRPVPTATNMFTQSPDLIGFVRALAWLLPWHHPVLSGAGGDVCFWPVTKVTCHCAPVGRARLG